MQFEMNIPSRNMPAPIQFAIICDLGSEPSLAIARKLEASIRSVSQVPLPKFRYSDFRQPFIHSDVNVHIGLPIYSAVPWAFVNIVLRVDGTWVDTAHDAYIPAFDAVLADAALADAALTDAATISRIISLVAERRPKKGNYHCPPVLLPADCPAISVITPTRERRGMIDIAFHNLMATDYPADKIEWIVVEDGDDSTKGASDLIMSFQVNNPAICVKYIPIQGIMSIGEKRNIGVEHATNDIILFMDDDDHYPVTSFRRRVAWLMSRPDRDIAVCTTIALYDLIRGVSAVNMPPLNLPLGQRVSEATLTFKKSAWLERKFSHVSSSEGDEWISGRETRVLEMLPQQIIVAFSHRANSSGRRIPATDAKVGCFWGFPKEYLIFVHKLAGVEVEEVGGGSGH
jgi:hypothetical protein